MAEKIAATAPEGARAEDIRDDAIVSTAQLNAVSAGRKPAFLEPDIRRMRALAADLPPGLHYIESGAIGCIYRPEAVAHELGMPRGSSNEAVEAEMRRRFEAGKYGRIMGYGFDSNFDRPANVVSITRNGLPICGFVTSPESSEASRYMAERKKDFSDQFPEDDWDIDVVYRP